MKNLLFFILLAIACWIAYGKYVEYVASHSAEVKQSVANKKGSARIASGNEPFVYSSDFKCDGRNSCAQMRSCEEAKFFLNNCSTVRMDNNSDGIPCESGVCSTD